MVGYLLPISTLPLSRLKIIYSYRWMSKDVIRTGVIGGFTVYYNTNSKASSLPLLAL